MVLNRFRKDLGQLTKNLRISNQKLFVSSQKYGLIPRSGIRKNLTRAPELDTEVKNEPVPGSESATLMKIYLDSGILKYSENLRLI